MFDNANFKILKYKEYQQKVGRNATIKIVIFY